METHEIKTYSYNELPENIKEKVMEKYYDINTDYEWWDCLEYELKEMGIELISFDIDHYKCELKFINGGHERHTGRSGEAPGASPVLAR